MPPFLGTLIRLAALSQEDLPAFKCWFQDYEVERYLLPEVAIPMTQEAETEWYETVTKATDSYTFAIRTLADDQLIGNCSLFAISRKNREATFGIVIGDKALWGKGYGSDATRTMLCFAFEELNLNRVQLEVYAFNQRAIRAYEKVGFTLEGTRRAALYREGAYHDVHLMAILRDEWFSLNS